MRGASRRMLVSRTLSARGGFGRLRSSSSKLRRTWQPVVNHVTAIAPRHSLFTSDFKPIPPAPWHAPINAGTRKRDRQGACFEASDRARRGVRRGEAHRGAPPPPPAGPPL